MTDGNQSPDVRERAVVKVKTHPDYQAELIHILQTGYVAEAFQFLASNEVEDPQRFPEPIRLGILKQAEVFRETIRASSHPFHFYPELFHWETERILRTVDNYKGMGVDFKPAIFELKKSLDEKTDFERPKLRCEMVDFHISTIYTHCLLSSTHLLKTVNKDCQKINLFFID